MKVVGLVFSARKRGNGFNCMEHCLNKLEEKGLQAMLINAYDYEIKPCSHCNYECYAEEIRDKREECPLKDDIPKMYDMIEDADWLMFAIPCYGGHTPAIYRAWAERIPHLPRVNRLFKNFDEFQRLFLSKIKGIIIIVNLSAMADLTLHEVLADFYNIEAPEVILLQSREYGRVSLKGDLIKSSGVRERLYGFIELLIKRLEKQ